MSSFFAGVQSLRLRNFAANPSPQLMSMSMAAMDPYPPDNGFLNVFKKKLPPHSSHPNFANLTLLVFEAVLEVVCVSLPGYIIARMGMFDAESQKFLANLNTQLFTPCLSMLNSPSTTLQLLTPDSLHQAGLPALRKQARRARRHPLHLRRPNARILPHRSIRIQDMWIQEARQELRRGHGCMCNVQW